MESHRLMDARDQHDVRAERDRSQLVKRLIPYLATQKLKMAAVVGSMSANAAVNLLTPWPLKLVVDHALGQQPIFGLVPGGPQRIFLLALAALGYVSLAALRGFFSFLRHRWVAEVSHETGLAMRSDLFAQVQRLSLRFHDRARVGDMVTRVTADVEKLQHTFVAGIGMLSVDLLTVIGVLVIMFLVDWQLALVSLTILPPLLLIFSNFRRRIKEASRAVRRGEGAMASLAQEVIASIRVVKAFGQEDREHDRFLEQTRSQAKATMQAATSEGIFAFWVEVATAMGFALVLGYGGWRVVQGELTVGQMLVFLQYVTTMQRPLKQLSRVTFLAQRASASAERINELFDAAPEVREAPHAACLGRVRGHIEFKDVWFGYEPDRPVLRGVNLMIGAGEVVAVVGPTGEGKSTLVSLIPRFYDPAQGRVFLDGQDVRNLRLRSLREQFSIVLQDSILFSGSVRDNIAYGRPGASEREVLEAAQAAHAHEFIVDLPESYDTHVGERGVTLSGGQRQRIAIARALLKDAPILILDEPTSFVDADSERLIMEALARLIKGRTTVLITHRASLTELADRVVGLRDGVIAELCPTSIPS
jgi:ATP-binding cassette subfamily B protein